MSSKGTSTEPQSAGYGLAPVAEAHASVGFTAGSPSMARWCMPIDMHTNDGRGRFLRGWNSTTCAASPSASTPITWRRSLTKRTSDAGGRRSRTAQRAMSIPTRTPTLIRRGRVGAVSAIVRNHTRGMSARSTTARDRTRA